MKYIALLCLLAAPLLAAAESVTTSSIKAPAETAVAQTPQAVLDFELIENKGKQTTLLTSGSILVDIGAKPAIKAPVKNFGDTFLGDAKGVLVVREHAYVQRASTKTVFDEAGQPTTETELTPGVVAEGFRAQAVLAQTEGQALNGKLFVDLHKLEKIDEFTRNGQTIQLPEVKVTTFEAPLKEGESIQKAGPYTLKTKVNKVP